MSRREYAPASVTVPFYAALAALGMQGLPVPHEVQLFPMTEFDPAGWAALRVSTVDEVWAWASLLGAAPAEKFSEQSVSVTVKGTFAGIPVEVTATCVVEHPYFVNLRDRDADRRDLAAAVAAGEIPGGVR